MQIITDAADSAASAKTLRSPARRERGKSKTLAQFYFPDMTL